MKKNTIIITIIALVVGLAIGLAIGFGVLADNLEGTVVEPTKDIFYDRTMRAFYATDQYSDKGVIGECMTTEIYEGVKNEDGIERQKLISASVKYTNTQISDIISGKGTLYLTVTHKDGTQDEKYIGTVIFTDKDRSISDTYLPESPDDTYEYTFKYNNAPIRFAELDD